MESLSECCSPMPSSRMELWKWVQHFTEATHTTFRDKMLLLLYLHRMMELTGHKPCSNDMRFLMIHFAKFILLNSLLTIALDWQSCFCIDLKSHHNPVTTLFTSAHPHEAVAPLLVLIFHLTFSSHCQSVIPFLQLVTKRVNLVLFSMCHSEPSSK